MILTHIGGPTLLVEVAGWRLLTDPTFDPAGGHYDFGWGTSSDKVTGPAVDVADLPPIDAVLLTHDHHGDNLDTAGRQLLSSVATVLTTVAGARRLTGERRDGADVRGLKSGDVTRLTAPGKPDLEITATPARHGPPLTRPIVGDVVGFAVREAGGTRVLVWVTGDTVLYDRLRDAAKDMSVDVLVTHVGGVRFPITGPLRYTMTGRHAVELVDLAAPGSPSRSTTRGGRTSRTAAGASSVPSHRHPRPAGGRVRWLELGSPTDLS